MYPAMGIEAWNCTEYTNHHFAPKKCNNFHWSAIDLYCPANSQNWQGWSYV